MNNSQEIILAQISAIYDKPPFVKVKTGQMEMILKCVGLGKYYDEYAIYNALKIACADDFVRRLENGLDTVLGEHGAGLSEGQMQRIAIARAVYSNHPILLLDEATSALDEATALRLLNNLRKMTDKTVILVTHRMNQAGFFDAELAFSKDGICVRERKTCK